MSMPIGVPKVEYRLPGEPEADWIDLYNCLYRERMLFLCQDLGDEVANQLISLMLYLNAEDPSQPFFMYINSLGGSVTCGIGVYDIMRYLESGITTICMGTASSMASFVLAGGTYGRRLSLPHGRIMIHQPEGGSDGQASEILSESSEVNRIRQQIGLIYANRTQQSIERIARDMDRDQFMSADEAKSYGLIDFVARTATETGVDVEMLKLLTNSPSTPKPFRDLASARSMEEAQQVIRNLPEPAQEVVDDFKTFLLDFSNPATADAEFKTKLAVLQEFSDDTPVEGREPRVLEDLSDTFTNWPELDEAGLQQIGFDEIENSDSDGVGSSSVIQDDADLCLPDFYASIPGDGFMRIADFKTFGDQRYDSDVQMARADALEKAAGGRIDPSVGSGEVEDYLVSDVALPGVPPIEVMRIMKQATRKPR
jgi:ATP-dependent Clp protease, protease subunit